MVFVAQTVVTPYGNGVVQCIRANSDNIIVVRPLNWKLANNLAPTFNLNPKEVQPYYNIGDRIYSPFGYGVIEAIRDGDGIYIVSLINWQLANGKSPTLYLNEQSITKPSLPVNNKPSNNSEKEMSFEKVYKNAMAIKDQAKDLYKDLHFATAKIKYLESLDIMKSINKELNSEEKGKFVEMSIYCHSNLALCAFGENDYLECLRYGQSCLTLLETIEKQDISNPIWEALQTSGVTMDKLKDQKLKVLRVLSKCEMKRQNFQEALEYVKVALIYSTNVKATKELNDLLSEASKKLSQLKKKEKNMWQSAFKKGSEALDESITPPLSPARSSSNVNNGFTTSPVNGTTSSSSSTTQEKAEEKSEELLKEIDSRFPNAGYGKKKNVSGTLKKQSSKANINSGDQQVSNLSSFLFDPVMLGGVTVFGIAIFCLSRFAFIWSKGRK